MGSNISSPSGAQGGAPAANAFWGYFEARKRFWWQCFCSFSENKTVVIVVIVVIFLVWSQKLIY